MTLLAAIEKKIDEKSKVLIDLEVVLILSSKDMKELERHEQIMVEMQSSLNPNAWMDND